MSLCFPLEPKLVYSFYEAMPSWTNTTNNTFYNSKPHTLGLIWLRPILGGSPRFPGLPFPGPNCPGLAHMDIWMPASRPFRVDSASVPGKPVRHSRGGEEVPRLVLASRSRGGARDLLLPVAGGLEPERVHLPFASPYLASPLSPLSIGCLPRPRSGRLHRPISSRFPRPRSTAEGLHCPASPTPPCFSPYLRVQGLFW